MTRFVPPGLRLRVMSGDSVVGSSTQRTSSRVSAQHSQMMRQVPSRVESSRIPMGTTPVNSTRPLIRDVPAFKPSAIEKIGIEKAVAVMQNSQTKFLNTRMGVCIIATLQNDPERYIVGKGCNIEQRYKSGYLYPVTNALASMIADQGKTFEIKTVVICRHSDSGLYTMGLEEILPYTGRNGDKVRILYVDFAGDVKHVVTGEQIRLSRK